MTLFEFTFGLSAVILGLALAHMAGSVHRLALAGRRVRWASEPVLLAGIIFLVIVSVWLFQWDDRARTQTTIGLMLLEVGKLIFPFMAAAFVFPETVPDEGDVDLMAHYDRTRVFTYGALILGLLMFWADGVIRWLLGHYPQYGPPTVWGVVETAPWGFVGVYLVLIHMRRRWISRALLAVGLVYYAAQIVPMRLVG